MAGRGGLGNGIFWILLCLATASMPACRQTKTTPPNVILITVDCLRYDRAAPGAPLSGVNPNVARFVSEAVSFRRALVTAPWTLPSLSSLVMSRHPIVHGAVAVNAHSHIARARPERTLADVLAARGYRTAAFIAHGVVVEPERNLVKGFAEVNPGLPPSFRGKLTGTRIERAFRRWSAKREDAPFFAWLHYMELHAPPTEGNPYLGKIHPRYDAEMRHFDDSFGRLRKILERRGLWDSTIVVLTSDHGEELGDHGAGGHQHTLFDELLHVPLSIKLAGSHAGRLVNAQIELVDLAPTLLDALGFGPEPSFHGKSRLGWMRGEPPVEGPSFASRYFCRGDHLFSTTFDGWKLIGFVPFEGVASHRPSTLSAAAFPNGTHLADVVPVVADAAEIPHPLERAFSGDIALAGYGLRRSRLNDAVVYLDLYWKASAEPGAVPERTVILRRPGGHGGQRIRSLIADGDLPAAGWQPGTILRETLWLLADTEVEIALRPAAPPGSGRTNDTPEILLGRFERSAIPLLDDRGFSKDELLEAGRDLARHWSSDVPGARWKLYDLTEDPGETRNLYWAEPRRAADLQAALLAARNRLNDDADPGPVDADLSTEQAERLRSLGYLQ